MSDSPDVATLLRALERERRARKESERLLEEKSRELYEANNRLRTVNVELEEVLERRAAEIARAVSRFHALIEQLPFGILVEDDERRVVVTNTSLCEMFAIPVPPDAMVGSDCEEAGQNVKILFEDPETFIAKIAERVTERYVVTGERLQLADGRSLERDYVPVSTDGRSVGHMWIYRDVTELEVTRRSLEKARRVAVSANEQKSQFLAMMSHELRTPLSVVVGASEILSGTGLDDDQTRLVRRLRLNASNMLHQISDLLEFSKLEADEVRLERATFDPVTLVEDVAEALVSHANDNQLELVVDIDPNVPTAVRGDPDRVRQILTNLVSNAIKFTASGHVVVRAHTRTGSRDKGRLCFEVEDTGRGIPQEHLARIFDRFVRVKDSRAVAVPGTGLGLSISRALANLMNGELSVRSEHGSGSTFTASFPLERAASPRQNRPLRGKTVALLGFSPAAVGAATRLLRALECEVVTQPPGRLESEWLESMPTVDAILYDPDDLGRAESDLDPLLSSLERLATVPRVRVFDGSSAPDDEGAQLAGQVAKPLRRTVTEDVLRAALTPHRSSGRRHRPTLTRLTALQGSLRGRGRVLLVDDDPDNLAIVRWQLRELGLNVDTASDGRIALEKARQQAYALVITDIGMPNLDGFGFARALRTLEARCDRRRAPVIALSAHARADDGACEDAGIDAYLTKPCDASTLRDTLERWLPSAPVVLLVDDAPDLRAITARRLSRLGPMTVVEAGTGEDALERVEDMAIDLVLLDMNLPGLDGDEVARKIRKHRSERDLPIIAVTGDETESAAQRSRDAGCTEHLIKPLDRPQLERLVRTHLRTAV